MKKKIKKIFKYIKDDIKTYYKTYIVFLLIFPWLFISFDYNIYSPGGLIELTDRIEVDSNNKVDGSFNLTYVTARKGTIPNILISLFIPSWDIVNVEENQIEEESRNDILIRNKIYLKETSYDAIIAAFEEAGLGYKVEKIDLTVTYVFEMANTDIKLGDVVKSVNGTKVTTMEDLSNELSKYKAGDKVKVSVMRDEKIVECYANLIEESDRIIIGIALAELKEIKTNPKVKYIFKDNESGSSRGLMCALEIYNKIVDYDITKGDIIAGTGSIDETGKVGAIDGVKYKLKGAIRKKAKVFIVPSDNYQEAMKLKEKNNYDIEIIEADTLHNVIEKLKNRN